jgi:hypothetical protein
LAPCIVLTLALVKGLYSRLRLPDRGFSVWIVSGVVGACITADGIPSGDARIAGIEGDPYRPRRMYRRCGPHGR